ncbi:MAG: hypothetical protein ACYDBJ_00760 [Aggregatilineales bacterium]
MEHKTHEPFPITLKKALDDHHPGWKMGHKGQGTPIIPFITVSQETLEDWADGKHRPQRTAFSKFLKEAEFPTDTYGELLRCYHAFHPGRKGESDEVSHTNAGTPISELRADNPMPPFIRRSILVWLTVFFLIAGVGGMVVYRVIVSISDASPPLAEVKYPNGWCAAMPTSLSSDEMAKDHVVISDTVPLGDFEQHPYYVYFDGQYVGADVANLEGDNTQHQWQFTISPAWVTTHSSWIQPSLWHIDYRCSG